MGKNSPSLGSSLANGVNNLFWEQKGNSQFFISHSVSLGAQILVKMSAARVQGGLALYHGSDLARLTSHDLLWFDRNQLKAKQRRNGLLKDSLVYI